MEFIPVVGQALGIANGVKGLFGGGSKGGQAAQPEAADPFSPYRRGYAEQLNSFWNNPGAITSDPAFQAQLQQGIGAVNAGMAASGQLASGGQMAALNQLGMNTYNQFRQQQLANLMQLSGASQNPAAGASAAAAIAAQQYGQQRQGMGDILGGLGGLSGLFKSGGLGGRQGSPYGGYDWQNDRDFLDQVGL